MQTQFNDIEDLVANVQALAVRKRDFIASPGNAIVQPDGKTMVLTDVCDDPISWVNANGSGGQGRGFKGVMDEHFIRGLSDFAGLPKRYVDQMIENDRRGLLAENLNNWLQDPPNGKLRSADANKLFRAYDGDGEGYSPRFRSLHSDKFRIFDYTHLLKHVYPVLKDIHDQVGELDIRSLALTEKRIYLKIFFPQIQKEIAKGDIVRSGVVISNSEIGQGSIEVWPMILRLLCLNGMTADEGGKRKKHLGRVTAEGEIDYAADTIAADNEALSLKLRDVVKKCADETQFAIRCASMTEAAEGETPSKPLKSVELVTDTFSLSEWESESVTEAYIAGQDYSKWGMLNAVTSVANNEEVSYDRASHLEKIGGRILQLNRDQWGAVCNAGTGFDRPLALAS
jgi:hypothetical protein